MPRVHWIAPDCGFRPYTLLFSVATISMPPATKGWAKTCPSTVVEKICPKAGSETSAGLKPGSFRSHPVRALSTDTVVSSALAGCGWARPAVATAAVIPSAVIRDRRVGTACPLLNMPTCRR